VHEKLQKAKQKKALEQERNDNETISIAIDVVEDGKTE